MKQKQNKTGTKSDSLSLTVSLVTSLSAFHSFVVKRELIVNNSISTRFRHNS